MIDLTCKKCGGSLQKNKEGIFVCLYCGSSFLPEKAEQAAVKAISSVKSSNIDLRSDVQALLEKCKKDPKRARRYANLILDIDPTNKEAQKYL